MMVPIGTITAVTLGLEGELDELSSSFKLHIRNEVSMVTIIILSMIYKGQHVCCDVYSRT